MPSTTRRRFLRAISAGGIPTLAGCGMPSPDSLSGWAQFGYDPANTSAALDLHGPAERPGPEWIHTAGSYYRNSTQILLAENVIANAGYTGLYALSPTDGTIQWHDSTSYKPLTPTLANGIIVPGGYGFRSVARNGGISVGGHRLGYRNWQTDWLAYPQSPATLVDGLIIAGVGTEGHSRGGGRVIALDQDEGTIHWSTPVESTVWGTPAVADGVVYAAQRSTRNPPANAVLYALEVETGDIRWRRDFGDDPRFDPIDAPVAGEELVYVSTGTGPLLACDAASGEVVWTLDPPSGVQGSPALANDTLYVGDLDGTFHAVDAKTGETHWTAAVSKWYSGPMVARDGIYAVTFDGELVSWRPNGTERWRLRLDPPVKATPVVRDGRLYLGTTDGLLYCLA